MGAVFVPDRTREQRMTAIDRANEVRVYRAEVKRRVKRGELDVPTLLAENADPRLHTMKVRELLLAQLGWGDTKVDRLLRRCDVSPSKSVDGLTGRQRRDLVRGLYGSPPAQT